jgi:hypothetical protein
MQTSVWAAMNRPINDRGQLTVGHSDFSSDCMVITYWYLSFVTFYVTYGFSVTYGVILLVFATSFSNIFNVIFNSIARNRMYQFIFFKTKLRGLSPQVNYTDRATPLVGEVRANFCG